MCKIEYWTTLSRLYVWITKKVISKLVTKKWLFQKMCTLYDLSKFLKGIQKCNKKNDFVKIEGGDTVLVGK